MNDGHKSEQDGDASAFDWPNGVYRSDREARETHIREANRLLAALQPSGHSRAFALLEQAFTPHDGKYNSLPERSLVDDTAISSLLRKGDRATRLKILEFLTAYPPPNKLAAVETLRPLFVHKDRETFSRTLNVLAALGSDVAALLGREIVQSASDLDDEDSWHNACQLLGTFAGVDLRPLVDLAFSALQETSSEEVRSILANYFVAHLPSACPELRLWDELVRRLGATKADHLLRLLGQNGRAIRGAETSGTTGTQPPVCPEPIAPPPYKIIGNTLVYEWTEYALEPHLARWLEALLATRSGGPVSGDDLRSLPGSSNKNVSREFKKLLKHCEPVYRLIVTKDGLGGGYYLQK